MSKVAVIYWSGTGNTAAMADAVAQGVESAGGKAEVITADAFDSLYCLNLYISSNNDS